MTIIRRVGAFAVAAGIVLGLVSCGGGTAQVETDGGMAAYQLDVTRSTEPVAVRDAAELEPLVESATTKAKELKDEVASDKEEGELTKKADKAFNAGNDAYRSGSYEDAVTNYEKALKKYPLHLGANVNLALALLQCDRAEDALVQALVCAILYPDEAGPLLNVQVTGTACGFASDDIVASLERMRADQGDSELGTVISQSSVSDEYAYNRVWNRIETELVGGAGEQDDGDAGGTSADRRVYDELVDQVELVEVGLSGDDDPARLHAYLYAVGLQLGLEVDPAYVTPATSVPFTVADDELCTLAVTGLESSEGTWNLACEFTNNTEDKEIGVISDLSWTVNDEPAEVVSAGPTIAPGESTTRSLPLTSEVLAEGADLTSFSGVLVVTDVAGLEIARYPLSWKAPEE